MSATRPLRVAAGGFDRVMVSPYAPPKREREARPDREADDHRIVRRMRDLPQHMIEEIRTLEGIRTAHEVAEEFDIYAWRVRAYWNETLR